MTSLTHRDDFDRLEWDLWLRRHGLDINHIAQIDFEENGSMTAHIYATDAKGNKYQVDGDVRMMPPHNFNPKAPPPPYQKR